MAAKKLTPQQQRDRRSKIMLAVLGVVFIGVLAIQLPKLMKHGGAATPPPAPAATTPAPTTALASAGPASSQLTHFTRFAPKDPFKPGVKATASGSSSAGGATTSTSTTPQQPKQPAPPKQDKRSKQRPLTINVTQSPPPTVPTVPAALLKVNGKKTVLALGAAFPKKTPIFRVVALSQKAIWIELVAGSFPNGQQTLKLDLGRKITLKNVTADTKFVLSMVKPTTAPAQPKTSG
jgi:hypothetical protein